MRSALFEHTVPHSGHCLDLSTVPHLARWFSRDAMCLYAIPHLPKDKKHSKMILQVMLCACMPYRTFLMIRNSQEDDPRFSARPRLYQIYSLCQK